MYVFMCLYMIYDMCVYIYIYMSYTYMCSPKADLERQKMLSFLAPETTTTKALAKLCIIQRDSTLFLFDEMNI